MAVPGQVVAGKQETLPEKQGAVALRRGFQQDVIDNKGFAAKGKLTMPVLAIGADKSFGTGMADDLRFVATNVTSAVIPNSGHWLMEEQPVATMAAIRSFHSN